MYACTWQYCVTHTSSNFANSFCRLLVLLTKSSVENFRQLSASFFFHKLCQLKLSPLPPQCIDFCTHLKNLTSDQTNASNLENQSLPASLDAKKYLVLIWRMCLDLFKVLPYSLQCYIHLIWRLFINYVIIFEGVVTPHPLAIIHLFLLPTWDHESNHPECPYPFFLVQPSISSVRVQ